MADDPQAQNVPVKDTPDAPMPSADQQTGEPEGQAAVDSVKDVSVPDNTGELPESASERTKREFEKLRRELREERTKRLEKEGLFNAMRPPVAQPTPTKPDWLVDPDSQTVDVNKLHSKLTNAEQRATRAEMAVNNYIQEVQTREALAAHPELDSRSDKFDPELHRKTRAYIFDSMMNPDDYNGKTLTYKEAGDMAKGIGGKAREQAEIEGAKKAIETLTPKEQASLEAVGRSDRRADSLHSLSDLQTRSRQGDDEAIVERLKRSKL